MFNKTNATKKFSPPAEILYTFLRKTNFITAKT